MVSSKNKQNHKTSLNITKCTVITLARPNLDYGDILYEQVDNILFHKKLESVQYSACFTINGEIGGTPKDKIYQELGLESLQLPWWYKKLGMFFKIYQNKSLYSIPLN